jgi:hypothetical protein
MGIPSVFTLAENRIPAAVEGKHNFPLRPLAAKGSMLAHLNALQRVSL